MERRTALTVLGLTDDADLATLKQRFRMLARDRHPDRGGDRVAFQDLHTAYELLLDELTEGPERSEPGVARGRPSRSDDARDIARQLDAAALDAATTALAERLVAEGTCRYLSRAPGARTNRLAASLAIGTSSTLTATLLARRTPSTPRTVHVELSGRGRAARRALTALDVGRVAGAGWSRRRGDATTIVEADLTGSDVNAVAHRAAAATERLLETLDWPLTQWCVD